MTLYVIDPTAEIKTQFEDVHFKDAQFFKSFKEIEYKLKFKDFLLVDINHTDSLDGFDPQLIQNKDIIVFANDTGSVYSLGEKIDFKKMSMIIDKNSLVYKNDLKQLAPNNNKLIQQIKDRVKLNFTNAVKKSPYLDERSKSKNSINKFFNNTSFSNLVQTKDLNLLVSKSETKWFEDIFEDYINHLINIHKISQENEAKMSTLNNEKLLSLISELIQERKLDLTHINSDENTHSKKILEKKPNDVQLEVNSEKPVHNEETKTEDVTTKNKSVAEFQPEDGVVFESENEKTQDVVEDKTEKDSNETDEDMFAFNEEEKVEDTVSKEESPEEEIEESVINDIEIEPKDESKTKESLVTEKSEDLSKTVSEEKPKTLEDELNSFKNSNAAKVVEKPQPEDFNSSFDQLFDELKND